MQITKTVIAVLWLGLFHQVIATFNELAGDLPKVITADKSPYLIVADIFVPAGKVVKVEPGTVFLFKNFTGIHIRGILNAKGNALHPVVFSSESDHKYNKSTILDPTPFDWNGIYIHKDGLGTDLENTIVSYSVKGIISETKFIRLANCYFNENGRSNCTIEGEDAFVTPGEPFTHNVSVKDATVDGVPVKILQDPEAPKRNSLRYSGLSFFAGCAVVAGIFGYQTYISTEKLKDYSHSDYNIFPEITYGKGNEEWKKRQHTRNRNIGITAGSAALCIAGGIVFAYSYSF